MTFRKALIHAIAECRDCPWRCEDYLTAQEASRKHHIKTGHSISMDLGYAAYYERSTASPPPPSKPRA